MKILVQRGVNREACIRKIKKKNNCQFQILWEENINTNGFFAKFFNKKVEIGYSINPVFHDNLNELEKNKFNKCIEGEWFTYQYPLSYYMSFVNRKFILKRYQEEGDGNCHEVTSLGPFDYTINENEILVEIDNEIVTIEYSIPSKDQLWIKNRNKILFKYGRERVSLDHIKTMKDFYEINKTENTNKKEKRVEQKNEPEKENTQIKELSLSSSIPEKKLFYPEKTRRSIDELTSILLSEHFIAVQKRLSENNMRTGFACLFSGDPGIGKTETARQIARLTGRDVMQVDISSVKSKWFGESQKQIKAVFDKYRAIVKKCETTPMLLFDEADAVFGKRQLLGNYPGGTAHTENAIQNIILQEIENLNGILIATTNLSNNLDAAFERRFLYKIEFEKPETETRKAIWCSLMHNLSEEDAWALASRFDFSGGQIENIARKYTVHWVLHGKYPALEDLFRLCDDEHREKLIKIGFVA